MSLSFFFLDMTEENFSDELDFYDFLEAVSDKIDSITQQSKSNVEQMKFFMIDFFVFFNLVEERKEDSRQLWARTKEEVEEQKRLLKEQLQKRIHVWSDNVKKSTFIRTRDKVSFSIGVANACFSPLIAGRWPHLLPLVYTIQALFLIPLRFFIYKRKSWHYFGRKKTVLFRSVFLLTDQIFI